MTGPAEFVHGPILIGTMINVFLYGIMTTQVYIYFTTYKRDHMFIKILVFVLFVVDAINTVFQFVYIYNCLIPHFGDIKYLETVNWVVEIVPPTTGVITMMVQLFYAWRIHVLTRNWFLVAFVASLSVTSAAFCFVATWKTFVIDRRWDRINESKNVAIVWLGCAVIADIMITVILVWHLVRYYIMFQQDVTIELHPAKAQEWFPEDGCDDQSYHPGHHANVPRYQCGSGSRFDALSQQSIRNLYSNSLVSNLNSRGGWKIDAPATPEHESSFVAHGIPNPIQTDFTIPQPSIGKPETSHSSTIFAESHMENGSVRSCKDLQVQGMALQEKDPEG